MDDTVWKLVLKSDDPEKRTLCISEANNCPAGRLIIIDKKTGKKIEIKSVPLIGLVEDIAEKSSGPIWVKGAVQIESADGFKYEIRENQTLCRCGQSKNKPFCNGAHCSCQFYLENY